MTSLAEVYRLPFTPDFDIVQHFGSLPGVECVNAEVRRPDQQVTPVAGAMCFNVSRLIYPDHFVLWNKLVGQVMGVVIP